MADQIYFVINTLGEVYNVTVGNPESDGWQQYVDALAESGSVVVERTSEHMSAGVTIGWKWDQVHGFSNERVWTKEELYNEAASQRYELEVSGITVEDIPVNTSRDSQALIMGAYNMVTHQMQAVDFVLSPDTAIRFDGDTVIAVAVAVGQHVQSCFSKQAQIIQAISEGSITTPEEISLRFSQAL